MLYALLSGRPNSLQACQEGAGVGAEDSRWQCRNFFFINHIPNLEARTSALDTVFLDECFELPSLFPKLFSNHLPESQDPHQVGTGLRTWESGRLTWGLSAQLGTPTPGAPPLTLHSAHCNMAMLCVIRV